MFYRIILEIFFVNSVSLCLFAAAVMFNFPDAAMVKKVVHSLPRVGVGTNFGLPQTRLDTQLKHNKSFFVTVTFLTVLNTLQA